LHADLLQQIQNLARFKQSQVCKNHLPTKKLTTTKIFGGSIPILILPDVGAPFSGSKWIHVENQNLISHFWSDMLLRVVNRSFLPPD
jgi:hypothetical protein